jgi:hypothetical protein
MMGLSRTFRAVGSEIRTLILLFQLLGLAEDEATLGVARFIRYAMMATAGGISIWTALQITQQGNVLPVGQTTPGQMRDITASGPAWVDRGEKIFTPPKAVTPEAMGMALAVPIGLQAPARAARPTQISVVQHFNLQPMNDPWVFATTAARYMITQLRNGKTGWMPR